MLVSVFWASAALSEPLRLATSHWPPYVSKDLPQQGVAVEIVSLALTRAGIESRLYMTPTWKGAREGVEVGVYDAILGTWYSDKLARTHLFSIPFLMSRLSLIRKKGSGINYRALADIEGQVVATVNGHPYGENFETYPGIYKIRSNHAIQALMKLVDGRADLVLGDAWVMGHELKNYMPSKLSGIDVLPAPFSEKGLRIAMRANYKQGEKIIARFNDQILEMKKEGILNAIIEAHNKGYH